MRCGSGWRNWKPPTTGWWTCCGDAAANAAASLPISGSWTSPTTPRPPSPAEQEIITAQAQADEAADRELLRRLEARRKARQEKQQQQGREEFPPHIERRERVSTFPKSRKRG